VSAARVYTADGPPLPCGCPAYCAQARHRGGLVQHVVAACPEEGWLRLHLARRIHPGVWLMRTRADGSPLEVRLELDVVVRCPQHPEVPCP
jgi:hypothetical protein